MNISEILAIVGELGFVDIRKDGAIYITPPAANLHTQRLDLFAKLLFAYKKMQPDAVFKGFFTLYDAWREHAEPSADPLFFKTGRRSLEQFVGKGTLGEPGRFIQPYCLRDSFPVFDYPVLSFGRHKNDPFALLIPDTDFIGSGGYLDLRDEIDHGDCCWQDKTAKLFWRGGQHGFPYKAYDPLQLRSQRALLVEWGKGRVEVCDAEMARNVSKREQLRYKYLLDVDGEVNAWSGLYWKLYSSSVVFKVASHYEQWYYPRLKPWEHYVPVSGDLSDLEEKFNWALSHDDACCRIAQAGREFASSLTFEGEVSQLELVGRTDELFSSRNVSRGQNIHFPQLHELTVVHTYQPRCATVSQPPGFGDFLRGTITLHQLSRKYGFDLHLDFSGHPLNNLLMQRNCSIEYGNAHVHEFFNQKNCELESFIVGQAGLGRLCVTTHAVPYQQITRQSRQFIQRHLKPTKELSDHIQALSAELGFDSYCAVHLRMGDHQFDSELAVPPVIERWFTEDILPLWGKNVVVVSDNISVKHELSSRFDVKILDIRPVHLGQSVLCEASDSEVRDTFVEFLLMSRASWIYQYSVYPWGSSFSEICADIYEIPFERFSGNKTNENVSS